MRKNIFFRLVFSFIILLSYHFSSGQFIQKSIEKKFATYKSSIKKERVFLVNDRDVYAPGETIWLAGFTYDFFTPNIVNQSSEFILEMYNPENLKVSEKTFKLVNGNAQGFLNIPLGLEDGIYYLYASTLLSGENNNYYRKIVIKENAIPSFIVEVDFADKIYQQGDEVQLNIKFTDFYNEPEKNVNYELEFFNNKKRISGKTGKTKKEGVATSQVKIPTRLSPGLFYYRISADSKKKNIVHYGVIPVQSSQVHVDFYPANGSLVNEVVSEIYFYSYDENGDPLEVSADLMEFDRVLQTFSTDSDGIGKFSIIPDLKKEYYLSITNPNTAEIKFDLPEIHAKGVGLSPVSNSSGKIVYKLKNGYIDPRLVYLVGSLNGELVWFSEHDVIDELDVEVDISEAGSGLAHFALVNAAERIEGEHVIFIKNEKQGSMDVQVSDQTSNRRSGMDVKVSVPQNGQLVFASANNPWVMEQISNQNPILLSLPYDFMTEPISQSYQFNEYVTDQNQLEKYAYLYTPDLIGWDKVLGTKGVYSQHGISNGVVENSMKIESIKARGSEKHEGGRIVQTNINGANYFYTSNPEYIHDIHKTESKRVPSYKIMLENGTPVLDVLKTIKPYTLEGSNIIFTGSPRSINAQGGALIAIDGVNRGTDAAIISSLSPYDIETITASTDPNDIQRYTGLNSVGIIEIELKKGKVEEAALKTKEHGPKFEAPNYDEGKKSSTADYRYTLYWSSEPVTSGSVNLRFFNSDLISDVNGEVLFFPDSGTPTRKSFEYQIK